MVKQKKVKNISEKKMWKIFGLKKSKNKKNDQLVIKVMQVLIMVKFWILLIMNYR